MLKFFLMNAMKDSIDITFIQNFLKKIQGLIVLVMMVDEPKGIC